MAIMPKFKPGQLVEWGTDPDDMLLGLVVAVSPAPRRGAPVFIQVQWCGDVKQRTEFIPQDQLTLVED